MGSFNLKASSLNSSYEYKNNVLVVTGSIAKDALTNTLQSLSGACHRKNSEGEAGDYVGNFNSHIRNGEIKYSLSEMSRQDSNLVWDAIEEIEPYVLGENQEENSGE